MQLALIFLTSFLIAMSGALIPGPMLAVTIKESLQHGWIAGLYLSLGHCLTEVILILLLALGLGTIIQGQWITAVVGIAGGLVLLVMGFDMIIGGLKGKLALSLAGEGDPGVVAGESTPGDPWPILGSGIVVSVANPTWVIWWATIGVLYVTQALKFGLPGLISFYTGHFLADFAWYVLVAVLVATGMKFFSRSVYRWVLLLCGLLMVSLALFFIFQGVQTTMHLY